MRTALREIRRSLYKSSGRSIDLLSLEGWCTYLLFLVEQAREVDLKKRTELLEEFSERWQELKSWDCNPWPLISYFDRVLSGRPPVPTKKKEVIQEFDPWHRTTTARLSGDSIDPWLPAFAYVRLFEQVGLPMRLTYFNTSNESLRNACSWISPFIGSMGPAILIRNGSVKDLTAPGILDRVQVAIMDPDLAKKLNTSAIGAIKRESLFLGDRVPLESAQVSVIEVLIELVSRLTFKLEPRDLQDAFDLALKFHRHPALRSHIRLCESCIPWFRRLFETADDLQLFAWIPQLIRFPLSDEREETDRPISNDWLDPMDYFPYQRLRVAKKSSPDVISNISASTDWLLTRYGSLTETEQATALMRLICLYNADLLTKDQAKDLGTLLWDKIGAIGLPNLPGIEYCEYLHLPVPEQLDVASAVAEALLSLSPRDLFSDDSDGPVSIGAVVVDFAIRNWAYSSKPIVQLPNEFKGGIEWSSDETQMLWDRAISWWENNKLLFAYEKLEPFIQTSHLTKNLENLEIFLSRAVLPHLDSADEKVWDRILTFLSEVRKHEVHLNTAQLYVLICRPCDSGTVIRLLLNDLSSGGEKAVVASARAVSHWVYLYDAGFIEISPVDAIEELIRRVIFRRPEGLQSCLNQLALLLIEKPSIFDCKQVELIVTSLEPWSKAICTLRTQEGDNEFSLEERPELRALVGRLAAALSIWLRSDFSDQPEPTAISHLRESYKSDPLPEVRRSFDMRIP